MRVLWTAKRSNQSILEEINLKYSLEEVMMKLQAEAPILWPPDSFEKTLMLGKIEDERRG